MKKIISFSLYGNKPNFQVGAVLNVLEAKRLYPDWKCRFYTTDDEGICKQLEYLGAEVVRMDDWPEGGMFWRFLAVDDADICISRDCDSVVSDREAGAVEEWLKEDYQWHGMHDHRLHKKVSMMGGMWGYRHYEETNRPEKRAQESAYFFNFRTKPIRAYINEWLAEKKGRTTVGREWDQLFLGDAIYEGKAQTNIMWHGTWVNNPGRPFPAHEPFRYGKFVGDYAFPSTGYISSTKTPTPKPIYNRSVDRVILACDSHKDYIGFRQLASAAWKKIDVKATLVLIEKPDENIKIDETLGDVIRLKLPDNSIHSAFASQAVRLLAPCLYPDQNITISDVDIIPLSKNYFFDNLCRGSEHSFIQYRHGCVGNRQVPICWNAAKGSIWGDIFKIQASMENYQDVFIDRLKEWYPSLYKPIQDGESDEWYTDQKTLFKYLSQWGGDHVKITDRDTGFCRLDHRVKKVSGMHDYFTDFCPRRPPIHNLKYLGRQDLDNINSIKEVFDWYEIPWPEIIQ